jgi:hypothetical protein
MAKLHFSGEKLFDVQESVQPAARKKAYNQPLSKAYLTNGHHGGESREMSTCRSRAWPFPNFAAYLWTFFPD